MNYRVVAAALLLMLFVGVATAVSGNGGFETGLLYPWDHPEDPVTNIVVSTSAKHTGNYGLNVSPSSGYLTITQFYPIGYLDTHNVSFWYKAQDVTGGDDVDNYMYAQVVVDFYTDMDVLYVPHLAEGDWIHFDMSLEDIAIANGYSAAELDNGLVMLKFIVRAAAGRSVIVYIDDVLVPDEAHELANEGFETGVLSKADWMRGDVDLWGTDVLDVNTSSVEAANGTYSARYFSQIVRPDQHYPILLQEVPADWDFIRFFYKVDNSSGTAANAASAGIWVQVLYGDGFNIWLEEDITQPPVGDWVEFNVSRAAVLADNGYNEGQIAADSNTVFLMLEVFTGAANAGTRVSDIYIDDVAVNAEPPHPPISPVATSTLTLELIALCFLFLLASVWSEENVRFGYVLVPLVAAFFVWAGFLPFAYLTTVIPLMIFMGIFSFMRMQAKYKWGFMGTSGGILYKIVFFLIMIQMIIGYVNGMGIFASNSVTTPDNQFTGYTLTSAQSVYGANSYGIDVVDMITNGLQMTWMAFKVLWSMLSAVFFIYPTLVNQFMVPADLSLLLQAGIYVIYGLELFNMVFKPFKAAEV